VDYPVPVLSSLSPASVIAGSAQITLDVNGSNFIPTSVIQIGGVGQATTFVSTVLLQTTIPATSLTQANMLGITVVNPTPGGGTSATVQFGVTGYTVTVPTPSSTVTAGNPATYNLTVASANGIYTNPVTFSVTSSLPPETAATFSPSATITPSAVSQIVTLSIATTPHTLSSVPKFLKFHATNRPAGFLLILAGIVFALSWLALSNSGRSRQRLAAQILLVSIVLAAAGLAACNTAGGGSSNTGQPIPTTGTPAGNYTIVISATSGTNTHTASVTLTVM
jgi:predicted small secreted protein